jgi:hypothetical protein
VVHFTVRPSPKPGHDDITVLEPNSGTAQRRVSFGIRATELVKEAIDDIDLERLDHGLATFGYAGRIKLTDR